MKRDHYLTGWLIDWVAALTRKDARMAALGKKGGLKGGKAKGS